MLPRPIWSACRRPNRPHRRYSFTMSWPAWPLGTVSLFSLKQSALPDLSWTREIVDLLIQSLREVVVDDGRSSEPWKIQLLVGKPRERTS